MLCGSILYNCLEKLRNFCTVRGKLKQNKKMLAGEIISIHYTWEFLFAIVQTETKTNGYFLCNLFWYISTFKRNSFPTVPLMFMFFLPIKFDLVLTGGWNQLGLMKAKLFSLCVRHLLPHSSCLLLTSGVLGKTPLTSSPRFLFCWRGGKMKAPARATRKTTRSKSRVRPQLVLAYKEVRKQQPTCVETGLCLKCLVALKIVHICFELWPSALGPSGSDDESRLPDQSAQFSPTSCAQTGELGGLPAVKEEQNQSHCSGGDQCCCHTGEEENAKQNCCMKGWTLVVDFRKRIIKYFMS